MNTQEAGPPKASDYLKAAVRHIDGLTQDKLAEALAVSRNTVNELFNDKRSITPVMAHKLAYVLSTDANFWLDLQKAYDLFYAREQFERDLPKLKIVRHGLRADDLPLERAAG